MKKLILILLFIPFVFSCEPKKDYSICECADMYKDVLMGINTDFISSCLSGKYSNEVARYAVQQGWNTAMGDEKLVSYAGNFFTYSCGDSAKEKARRDMEKYKGQSLKFDRPEIKLRTFIPKNLPNSDNDLYKTIDILKKLEGYWISERELNDCFETKTGISIYFQNKNTNRDFTRFDNWYFSGYEDHNVITDVSISGKSIVLYVIGEQYETGELYESSFVFENFDFLNNKLYYNDGYSGQMIKMKDGDGNLINGIERSENGYGCEYNSKTDNQISEILTDENINDEDQPMYYVKSEGGLNVRNKAGNDGKKIATLIQNDLVYLISETDEILVINDFDEKTGVTNKVEGRWVKIKTYSPPKLKGDKIPWEDNKENVVGYVFNGFLNILDTDIDSHLRKLLK